MYGFETQKKHDNLLPRRALFSKRKRSSFHLINASVLRRIEITNTTSVSVHSSRWLHSFK